MRAVLLALAAYAAAGILAGPAAVATLALVSLGGWLAILVLDAASRRRRERASLRRIRSRLFAHACPVCGIRHGGAGQ